MKRNAHCVLIHTQVINQPTLDAINSRESNRERVVHGPNALAVDELNVKAELREVLQAKLVSDDIETELNETADSSSDFDVCL